MSQNPVRVPARPPRGTRVRHATFGIAAGLLLMLGAACGGGSDSESSDASTAAIDDGAAGIQTVANLSAAGPEGRPVLVAGAISEAPAIAEPATMPAWVTTKLAAPAPQLALNYPAQGSTFTDSYVVFSGKADPGATVAAGPFVTEADTSGNWSLGLVLSAGQNTATFTTESDLGIESKESVTVHHQPKQTAYASKGDLKPHSGYVKGDHDGNICPLKR